MKTGDGETHPWVRIPPLPPLQSLSGHCVYATARHQRLKQPGLRSHDPDLAGIDLDALSQRAQMVAAIASTFQPDTLTRCRGELSQHLRRDGLLPRVLEHGLRPVGIHLGLIADGLEAVDAVFQRRIVQIGYARFDGVIEPLEPQF